MKKPSHTLLSGVSLAVMLAGSQAIAADSVAEALQSGKTYGDFRLRYESADQDDATDKGKATALTIRSRLGYTTGVVSGFSATLEFEDSRIVGGQDEYAPVTAGYDVIVDPETTEVDQSFLQYKNDIVTFKAGRQVFVLDNHRFIGHVGWRQDRQTFDALSAVVTPVENLVLTYAYLDQRNRIVAETADVDSKDHILNAAYTSDLGKVVAYAYLLEEDIPTDNAIDTYGFSFNGSAAMEDIKLLYGFEYATQEYEKGAAEFDAEYMKLEGGVVVSGITLKAGYEVLGSDDGDYGFGTPLATLHKFNGWADVFLGTPKVGLIDLSLTASGSLAGGKWMLAYHDFEADDAASGADDLGSEIDLSYAMRFGKNYNAGVKYASYSAGDSSYAYVDTDKFWVWVGASF